MKTNLRVAVCTFFCISAATISWAQYPVIPPALEDSANKVMNEVKKRSNEAWQKALPIIEADAKNGKPYIPWASNPSDLPQAKIPAFPGAEGGGAYTFGGRGGKVFVVKM